MPRWRTRVWTDPDADPKEEGNWDRYQPNLRRTQGLLASDGRSLYHTIDRLRPRYAPGELVGLVPRTASNRGGWLQSTRHPLSGRSFPVLWANSNGFLSRRIEGVGRHDASGVYYADLVGQKIVVAEDRVYLLAKGGYGVKFPGLSMFPLDRHGVPAEAPAWTVKADLGGNHAAAFVLAGDRLLVAGHRECREEAFVHLHSAADGKKLAAHALPARPVRDGLAVAYGRLYVACEDGSLHCFGNGRDVSVEERPADSAGNHTCSGITNGSR